MDTELIILELEEEIGKAINHLVFELSKTSTRKSLILNWLEV